MRTAWDERGGAIDTRKRTASARMAMDMHMRMAFACRLSEYTPPFAGPKNPWRMFERTDWRAAPKSTGAFPGTYVHSTFISVARQRSFVGGSSLYWSLR